MKKILLIEDNADIRENTAEILGLAGFETIVAENGKIGVEKAIEHQPDLIVCDIMMPVLDGYGVLRLLSGHEHTKHIPFIFLTAKADRSDFRKGMEMGADDYLTKPFDDVELLGAIDSRLRKMDALKKEYAATIEGLDSLIADTNGEAELNRLVQNREVRSFKKKDEIYREGSLPRYLYYVQKGKIKACKSNESGKELIVDLFDQGDFFGYNALLQGGLYTESAVAMEETDVCLIRSDDFMSLLLRNHQVAQKFIQLLSKNIKAKEEQLIRLAYNSVRKRVAEALLKFNDHLNQTTHHGQPMKISREDLANLAGTSLETAIRTLSDFKDEKLVEIDGGRISILNLESLKKMRN